MAGRFPNVYSGDGGVIKRKKFVAPLLSRLRPLCLCTRWWACTIVYIQPFACQTVARVLFEIYI